MRILLVRIFYYYAFSLYLSYLLQVPTVPKVVSEERKERKNDVWS